MRLKNTGGFTDIYAFVEHKISELSKREKNFYNLFLQMFSESENVMAESSDGFKIKKVTYGECKQKVLSVASKLKTRLKDLPNKSMVGLYMSNSIEWIQVFWAILACGHNPVLMNSRLGDSQLQTILDCHGISVVVSDGEAFNVQTILLSEIEGEQEGQPIEFSDWGDKVYFMSSGTSEKVKLCAFTAENFFYQISDSFNIIKSCPQMAEHYEGELKNLVLLPLYHVFGFIAVYLWFGYFSRTLVFMKDLSAQTLLSTVKKHKVTHIFLVPLVWQKIYEEAIKSIKARGEKTFNKFSKALSFVNKHQILGSLIAKRAFKEVREKLFGDSIKFLITGGSGVPEDVVKFFNGIGYHMANGYGMTEVGITSLEISKKRKERNLRSVGRPFSYTKYKAAESGELLIKGKTMASEILQGKTLEKTDFDKWFNSKDLAKEVDGRFYILGRKDDLVIGLSGENLNPEIIEQQIECSNVENKCLISGKDNVPTLIVEVKSYLVEKEQEIRLELGEALKKANVNDQIQTVVFTADKLLLDGEIKVSRKKVKDRYLSGEIKPLNALKRADGQLSALEEQLVKAFADALQKQECEILVDSDFFTELGGTSLDYFALLDTIGQQFGIDQTLIRSWGQSTVRGFASKIKDM